MIIRGKENNREHWKTKIVYHLLPARQGITKAVKLQAGSHIWHVLFNTCIHWSCYGTKKWWMKESNENQLDTNAKEFPSRWNAATIAAVKVNNQIKNEYEVSNIEWIFDLLESNGERVSIMFQRTDFLVTKIFQRIDLCEGAHFLQLLCGSRKLVEPIRTIGLY